MPLPGGPALLIFSSPGGGGSGGGGFCPFSQCLSSGCSSGLTCCCQAPHKPYLSSVVSCGHRPMILIQTSLLLVVRCNTTMTRLANACTRFRVAKLQARHEGEGKALRQNLTAGIEKQVAESVAQAKLAREEDAVRARAADRVMDRLLNKLGAC